MLKWIEFSYVATASATCFYLIVFLMLLFPSLRKRLCQVFALPAPSAISHNPALDAVRGVAAGIVVIAHIWNFCTPMFDSTQQIWWWFLCVAGNKAVVVFVILSGFLIYRSVKKIYSIEDLKLYMQRRFYRIYPVYFFTVLLGFFVGQMDFSIPHFLSNVCMVRMIYPHALRFVNPPVWSLFAEVQFYIMLPVWVVIFRNRALLAAVSCFIVLLFVDQLGGRELCIWKFFFIGIITSELSDYLKNRIAEPHSIFIFSLGAVLLWLDLKVNVMGHALYDWFSVLKIVPKNPDQYSVGIALATMLILIGTLHSRWMKRLLGIEPLRILGAVSYSLFLIHPFFILAVFPKLSFPLVGTVQNLIDPVIRTPPWYLPFVMFPGCLLWAMMCFVLVEKPFIVMSRKTVLSKLHSA